jgi:hypothetical protein
MLWIFSQANSFQNVPKNLLLLNDRLNRSPFYLILQICSLDKWLFFLFKEIDMRGFIGIFSFLCAFLVFSSTALAQNTYGEYTPKMRFSVYGGMFSPSGDYKEGNSPVFEYESGVSLGVEVDYFMSEYFGIGGYLDINTFGSEEKKYAGNSYELSGSSVIFGVAGVVKGNIADNFWVLGALKLGVSSNSLSLKSSGSSGTIADTSGSSFAYSAEGGFGYLFNNWDIGLLVKYTGISQEIEGGGDTDLGGASFLVTVGYNF